QVTSGAISGYVIDPSNRPIASVPITATDPEQAVTRHSVSDSAGFYRLLDVPPGLYVVSAAAGGFEQTDARSVRVEVNSAVRLDFHPAIAGKGESVTVSAQVPAVATES